MKDEPADALINEWDESADGWDEDEATRAYAAGAFASLVELMEPETLFGKAVLDFGCGTGLLIEHLVVVGAAQVHGVDTSSAMLAVLDNKIVDRGWSSVATSQVIPADLAGFDVVVCSSVLAFVDDYPATVEVLVQQLKPSGYFVQWDWERAGDDPHGFTRAEMVDALERAGLDDVAADVGFEASAHGQTMRPLMGVGRQPPD